MQAFFFKAVATPINPCKSYFFFTFSNDISTIVWMLVIGPARPGHLYEDLGSTGPPKKHQRINKFDYQAMMPRIGTGTVGTHHGHEFYT